MIKVRLFAAALSVALLSPLAFGGEENFVSPTDGTIGTEHVLDLSSFQEFDIPRRPRIKLVLNQDSKRGDPKAGAKVLNVDTESRQITFRIQSAKKSGAFLVFLKGIDESVGFLRVNPPDLQSVDTDKAAPGDTVVFSGNNIGSKKPKLFANGKKQKVTAWDQNSVTIVVHKRTPGGAGDVVIKTKTGEDTLSGQLFVQAPVTGRSQITGNFGGAKIKLKATKKTPVNGTLLPGRQILNVVVGNATAAKPKPRFFGFAMNFGQSIDTLDLPATFSGSSVNGIQYFQTVINGRIPDVQTYNGGAGDLEVTVTNVAGGRMSGTFSGSLNRISGNGPANLPISDGTFTFDISEE